MKKGKFNFPGKPEVKRELIKQKKSVKEEKNENDNRLNQLLEESKNILFEASSFFPFDFFPDKITIDLTKITVVSHELYKSGEAHVIAIRDVGDILVESSVLFATLTIINKALTASKPSDYITIKIRYLKKGDAEKAYRIIQGLIFALKNGINIENLKGEKLVEKIEKLGALKEI